jgi:hypothetical protein
MTAFFVTLSASWLICIVGWVHTAYRLDAALAHAEAWRKCAKRWEDIATKLALPGKPND